MDLFEDKLTNKVPYPFYIPSRLKDYTLIHNLNLDWIYLCSLIIAEKPQIVLGNTLLFGDRLTVFKELLNTIIVDDHTNSIRISFLLSNIVNIEDLNNSKFNKVKELIAEIWEYNHIPFYELDDTRKSKEIKEIIYSLI